MVKNGSEGRVSSVAKLKVEQERGNEVGIVGKGWEGK